MKIICKDIETQSTFGIPFTMDPNVYGEQIHFGTAYAHLPQGAMEDRVVSML